MKKLGGLFDTLADKYDKFTEKVEKDFGNFADRVEAKLDEVFPIEDDPIYNGAHPQNVYYPMPPRPGVMVQPQRPQQGRSQQPNRQQQPRQQQPRQQQPRQQQQSRQPAQKPVQPSRQAAQQQPAGPTLPSRQQVEAMKQQQQKLKESIVQIARDGSACLTSDDWEVKTRQGNEFLDGAKLRVTGIEEEITRTLLELDALPRSTFRKETCKQLLDLSGMLARTVEMLRDGIVVEWEKKGEGQGLAAKDPLLGKDEPGKLRVVLLPAEPRDPPSTTVIDTTGQPSPTDPVNGTMDVAVAPSTAAVEQNPGPVSRGNDTANADDAVQSSEATVEIAATPASNLVPEDATSGGQRPDVDADEKSDEIPTNVGLNSDVASAIEQDSDFTTTEQNSGTADSG